MTQHGHQLGSHDGRTDEVRVSRHFGRQFTDGLDVEVVRSESQGLSTDKQCLGTADGKDAVDFLGGQCNFM
jgi:hypothetical protein